MDKSETNGVVISICDNQSTLLERLKSRFRKDALMVLTVTGIVIGFALGFGLREVNLSKDALMWLGMPGELFLRTLRMMILPLVFCSVISGTASLDPKCNCKVTGVALIYIFITNGIGCLQAIALVLLIKPGTSDTGDSEGATREMLQTQDIFADMLRNIVPDNIVEATFRQSQTKYDVSVNEVPRNFTNGTTILESFTTVTKSLGKADSINILGLITVCTIIGMAASSTKHKTKIFVSFFNEATEIVLIILRKFFWVAPIGICSLILVSIAGVSDIAGTFSQLGLFILTVTVGLLIHTFITLPAIYFLLTRKNPYAFLLSMAKPCMVAFAATSTAVAIPEMIEACEVKNKIDPRVARSIVPFSVTLNADGSAIYIATAALFIARISGTDVTAGDIVVIGVLTTIAALAIPSVPSASIVTLIIILTSVNISAHHIGLLFAVEWLLDRLRTANNLISHTMSVAVTYHFCKKNLEELDFSRTQEEKGYSEFTIM